MGLNVDRYAHRREALSSRGGGSFSQLKNGTNVVRFFTFDHKVSKEDYDRGFYDKSIPAMSPKIGSTQTELDRQMYLHMQEGSRPIRCPRTPDCEYCKQSAVLKNSTSKSDQALGKKMGRRIQHYVNAHIEGHEEKMVIVTLPTTVFTEIVSYAAGGEYNPDDLFGITGRDFIIERDTTKDPSRMYSVKIRDEKRCKALGEDLNELVKDLYSDPSLDNEGADAAVKEEEAETETETEEEEEEEEEEEGEETEEEEEEEEKPSKPAPKSKAAPAPAPKSKKPAPKEEEEEFEDEGESEDEFLGKEVTFKDDEDKIREGKVIKVTDGGYEVQDTTGDNWMLEAGEFELRKAKKPAEKTGPKKVSKK